MLVASLKRITSIIIVKAKASDGTLNGVYELPTSDVSTIYPGSLWYYGSDQLLLGMTLNKKWTLIKASLAVSGTFNIQN